MSFLRKLMQGVAGEQQARCRTCHQDLAVEQVAEWKFQRCPACRGTWLSGEALAAVLTRTRDKVDGEAGIANTFAPSRSPRGCPTCEKAMDNYAFEDSGVWIDACPDGHGLWLDQGELGLLSRRRNRTIMAPDQLIDAVSDVLLGSL